MAKTKSVTKSVTKPLKISKSPKSSLVPIDPTIISLVMAALGRRTSPKKARAEIGKAADSIDNLLGAMKLPMNPAFHLRALQDALPEISQRLKDAVVQISGANPWA